MLQVDVEDLKEKQRELLKELATIEAALTLEKAARAEEEEDKSDYYGYTANVAGLYFDEARSGGVPKGILALGVESFLREGKAMLEEFGVLKEKEVLMEGNEEVCKEQRQMLSQLTLSNQAIWDREEARTPIKAPWILKGPYLILCVLLDELFDGRPLSRFWFLEVC